MGRDIDEIVHLLQIVDLARQWPNLKGLHDQAMRELERLATHPMFVEAEPAKPKPKEQDELPLHRREIDG